ncbi:hypothetical protein REMIM1_PE00177 (plasmid) [Rhizobium etli bv. mimosae str. Mim1]|nr:hypothetical protein REMIM1_PE00177 [Rhizobium etli bv. mimosae str. Mim1]
MQTEEASLRGRPHFAAQRRIPSVWGSTQVADGLCKRHDRLADGDDHKFRYAEQ